jgi:hypothetical protein
VCARFFSYCVLELATQKEKISTDGGMMKAAAADSSIVWGKTRKQETVENVAGPTNTNTSD